MKTFVLSTIASITLADMMFRVDEQQFHHQYTRVVMLMFLGLVSCGGLALCGAIVFLLRR